MKKYIIVLLSFIIFQSAIGQEQKIKIEVEFHKTEYLLMEPIWFDLILTNVNTDTIRTSYLCPECKNKSFLLTLKDEKRVDVKFTRAESNAGGFESTLILNPKQEFIKSFNILRYFGNHNPGVGGIERIYLRFLPLGKYTLTTSHNGISSIPTEFEVVEPIGERKGEYDEIIKVYKLWQNTKSNDSLKSYIKRFPNSIYIEKILKDSNQKEELLEQFPNSGFSNHILKILVHELSVEEKKELLHKIIVTNPNTRSEIFAKQILNGNEQIDPLWDAKEMLQKYPNSG